jgi:sigma-54 dependent transcriptional regulator, acetoin dehydrogenase operon transcriptional activator AcoR
MSELQHIFAQQYATVIANALGVEVTIINHNLIRIAGTGEYKKDVGKIIPETFISARVIKEERGSIVVTKGGDNDLCNKCERIGTCNEKGFIIIPIIDAKKTLGSIGLICTTANQLDILMKKKEAFVEFAHSMTVLWLSKLKEEHYIAQLEENNQQMNSILSAVPDGMILINESGNIKNLNAAACKLLDSNRLNLLDNQIAGVFDNIDLEQLKNPSQSMQIQELPLNNKNKRLLCYINPIQSDNRYRGTVMIVMEPKKLNRIINQNIHDNRPFTFDSLIGESPKFQETIVIAKKFSKVNSNVFIVGESGVGKELFARCIHNEHHGMNNPFIPLNCAAIPETLIESELFGYEKGAFSGANQTGKPGKFELANGGTIFLDEIGDMPLHLQAKLLRVLQERTIERVGGIQLIPINVRVLAATNKDLLSMIKEKTFREDLYHRLNVLQIKLPSLRERRSDIPILTNYFLQLYADKMGIKKKQLDSHLANVFLSYAWPGNIRELQHTIEYACCVCPNEVITYEDVKDRFGKLKAMAQTMVGPNHSVITSIVDLERNEIIKALNQFSGMKDGKLKASLALGLSLATLYRKMKQYELHE